MSKTFQLFLHSFKNLLCELLFAISANSTLGLFVAIPLVFQLRPACHVFPALVVLLQSAPFPLLLRIADVSAFSNYLSFPRSKRTCTFVDNVAASEYCRLFLYFQNRNPVCTPTFFKYSLKGELYAF